MSGTKQNVASDLWLYCTRLTIGTCLYQASQAVMLSPRGLRSSPVAR